MIVAAQKKDSVKTGGPKLPNSISSESEDRAKKFLPQYAPLSPNAWSSQKFGDYQVNLATGIPSINIPLFTVQNGSLSMPISLNYHAGGFKMNEQASWVGWGFSLDIGASLNRIVQGLKDDDSGYLTNPITASRDFCYSSADFNYGESVVNNQTDTQPDIFSYSMPSKSGKFILGQNGDLPFKIPNHPVQISYSANPAFTAFNLVNDDGVAYTFGETESQNVISGASSQIYTSSWLVTQVRAANSTDVINYSYQNGGTQYLTERQWYSSLIFNANPQSGGHYTNSGSSVPNYTTVSTTIEQRNPDKITYTNGEVEFIQSNTGERLDLSNSYYLKQINIYNYEDGLKKLIKVIKFTYSYFQNNTANVRLKLDKITITDEINTISEEYSLDYWSNTISWNSNTDNEKKDFFGYYNGKSNTHLIPVSSYEDIPIDGGAADRSTVDTYMKEGVLKRITFPTSGYTEFDYETNKYNDGTNNVFAGGLRVKSIKSHGDDLSFMKRYEYSSSKGEGIGRLTTNWTPNSATIPKLQNLYYEDQEGTSGSISSATQASFTQSGGAVELNTMDAAPVYYTTVTEYFEEENDPVKNGKNVYTFDFDEDIILNAPTYSTRIVKPWKRGNLLTKTTYDANNNTVAYLTNQYNEYQVNDRLAGAFVNVPNVIQGPILGNCSTGFNSSIPKMVYASVYYQTGANLVVSTTNQIDNVLTTQTNAYTSELYLAETQKDNSQTGHSRSETFVYPSDASYTSDALVQGMLARNLRNQVLETEIKETISATTNTIYKEKKVFGLFTGTNARGLTNNILPKEIWVAPTGTTLEKRVEYTDYDTEGNPLSYNVDGSPTTLVWGYNNSLLLAQISNATLADVNAALSTASINPPDFSVTSLSAGQLSSVANFRNALPNAMVKWYTYRPYVGLSTTIAPNGIKTSFKYDGLLRLKFTKDHQDYITGRYTYQYGSPTNTISAVIPRVPSTDENTVFTLYNSLVSTQFFDGLGRHLQTFNLNTNSISGDTRYDKYGRITSQTLPTATTGFGTSYDSNVLYQAQDFYKDEAPSDTTIYESSPLNRVKETYGAGKDWRTKQKRTQVFYENEGSNVRYYTVDGSGNISKSSTYPANSLFKKRVVDEQGNTSIEITDKWGRLIQKQVEHSTGNYLTTYYIYDGLGRTLAVLQPEAYELNSNIANSDAAWSNFVFFYKYDARGRVIEKHVPNGGTNYTVFDKKDRVVLTQTAHQRTDNKWSYMKYDAHSRNVIAGEIISADTREDLQTDFNNQTITDEQYDNDNPENRYYTDVSFPFSVDSSKAMLINYYDSYGAWRTTDYEFLSVVDYTPPITDVKSLLSGKMRRNTENRVMLREAYYYDYRNRLQHTRKGNQFDRVPYIKHEYDFSNEITRIQRNFNPVLIAASKQYSYDLAGRKTHYYFNFLGSGAPPLVVMAKYNYDAISRLQKKQIQPNQNYEVIDISTDYISRPPVLQEINTQDIANKAVTLDPGFVADAKDENTGTYNAEIDTSPTTGQIDALQTIDYEYNIRGGLNCINCRNHLPSLGNKQNDLFSMRLDYNEDNRYHDGNISKQIWKTPVVAQTQQYTYSYDASSRLMKAKYAGGNSGSNFSLDTVRYDKNGNIVQLKRNIIDDLSYIYSGNQLLSVTDAATSAGFNDGNTSGNDYEYWPDGSLKKDLNKGIANISYNSFLKKVSRVEFTNGNWINFYYDAAGTLLKRKLSNNDVWQYEDELILKNGQVYQINHEEGRITFDYTNNKWVYEYDYRDHLGNLRVSFRDSSAAPVGGVYKPPVLVQVNDYDPWGMVLDQISFVNNQNKINNFDYSNRERQTEFGLNVMALGARMYDPLLGRFWSVDPVTENQENYSPYQYGWNNPVLRNDPNGDCPVCFFVLVGLLLASEPAMAPSGGKNQQREIAAYKQAYNDMGSDVVGSIMPGGRAKTVSQALYATVKKEVKEEIKEQAQKATEKASSKTNKAKGEDGYTPKEELLRKKDGTPQSDPEASGSHTQLGKKEGRKGQYRQAREFDKDGKVVKDIDFTDHGRPQNHPNPHQHDYKPNSTGGTPQRDPNAKPLNN
jgi:RHS repeat-associated protein